MRKLVIALSLAAAVAAGMVVQARRAEAAAPKVRTFIAVLTVGQEPAPVASTGSGVAFLTYDESSQMLSYSYGVTTTGQITAAHVHGPGQPGVNGAVMFPITASAAATGSVGPFSKAQAKDLQKGLTYLNFHTDLGPNGEIRGQIVPVASTYKPLPQ